MEREKPDPGDSVWTLDIGEAEARFTPGLVSNKSPYIPFINLGSLGQISDSLQETTTNNHLHCARPSVDPELEFLKYGQR